MRTVPKVAGQFVRYLFAGGIAFVVDFATLIVCVEAVGLHYLVGATLGFAAGSVTCYMASVRWVFDEQRFASRAREFVAFVLVGIVGLGLHNAAMVALVELAGIAYPWAKLVATGLVTTFNFGVRRVAVFSAPSASTEQSSLMLRGAAR